MNEGYMFYEIKEHIATLSEKSDGRFTIELNIINFRGKNDKYDLRRWDKENDKMLKGISLEKEEIIALKDALNKIDFSE